MRAYEDAKYLACNAIKKVVKESRDDEISDHNLEVLKLATSVVKNILTIMAMDEEGYSHASGRGRRGNSGRRGYSYADGKEDMIDQLEAMRDMAQSKTERDAIEKCIKQLEDDDD